jgi:hypothetical protein
MPFLDAKKTLFQVIAEPQKSAGNRTFFCCALAPAQIELI